MSGHLPYLSVRIKKLANANLEVLAFNGKVPDEIADLIKACRVSKGLPSQVQAEEYNPNEMGVLQITSAD